MFFSNYKRKLLIFLSYSSILVILIFYNNCNPIGEGTHHLSLHDNSEVGDNNDSGNDYMSESQRYFEENVVPVFKNSCNNCHSSLQSGGNAPLTIYNYTFIQTFLFDGSSSTNNRLINKMRNIIVHTGGNRCPVNGLNDAPCKAVVDWRLRELPDSPSGIIGAIDTISPSGTVSGWAKDPTSNTPIEVIAYVDGPFDAPQTTLIGTFTADQAGTSEVNRGFFYNFDLPETFKDGQTRPLYIYGLAAHIDNLLPGSPKLFTIYTPKVEGQNFYTATVRPQLMTSCSSCHTINYGEQYRHLSSPSPFNGGTATNNILIQRASGQNHPGGNHCPDGINNGLCQNLQEWWRLEFQ